MSTTEDRGSDAKGAVSVGNVDLKLKVIVIPAEQSWTELPA